MKRDLKKFLKQDIPLAENMQNQLLTGDSLVVLDEEGLNEFWIHAQKAVWNLILDEFDDDMDLLFGKHNKARYDKAQLVAYIASLKAHYLNKRRYLKRQN